MKYLSKKFLVGLSLPFLNENTNNLLILLKIELIRKLKLLFFGCFLFQIYICPIFSCKSLLYIFQKLDIIISQHFDNLNIMFSVLFEMLNYLLLSPHHTGSVFRAALDVLDVSDVTQYLEHDISSSLSHLMKQKLRNLQKLLKYFDITTICASNLLSLCGLRLINLSDNQKIYLLFFCCYLS